MGYHEDPEHQGNTSEIEKKEEYEFLQETVKDSKKQKKRAFLRYASLGLVFGMTASLGFFALKPWAQEHFAGNRIEVMIPEEESDEDSEAETETVEEGMTVDNYREMSQILQDVGDEASKSVVEVIVKQSDEEWQKPGTSTEKSVSGMIAADNGREYLIFARVPFSEDEEHLKIRFADQKSYDARLIKRDRNTEYAVYAVSKSTLEEGTKKKITVVTLGSTGGLKKGDTIIALGSPFGYGGAMGFGVVASLEHTVQQEDGEYRMIYTDITGADNGTGVLFDIQGEVVGMIDQRIAGEDSKSLIAGYGISDMKSLLEHMLNDDPVPYMGIFGVTVDETVSQQQGIPEGIYVQSVGADSPAMEAGVQSGDVIVAFDGTEINSLRGYHAMLMRKKQGDTVTLTIMRKGAEEYAEEDYKVIVGRNE